MKKLFFLLSLILISTICSAQVKVLINKEGAYQIKPDSLEWVDPGFTASQEALSYSSSFNEAISNPGKKILVEDFTKILKLKLLFKKQVEINKSYIVYNNKTNNIDFIESAPKTEEEPSYLIIFSIVSIVLMLLSNIFNNKKVILAFAAVFAAAFAAIFASFFAFFVFAAVFAALVAIFAVFAAVFAALAIAFEEKKYYRIFSVIFYILMVISITLLFI